VDADPDERGNPHMALPASGLYARVRAMLPEVMKFLVVGGIGTVIDLGGAAVLHSTYHVEPLAAKAVSVTVATIFTYFGSRFWTFRHRENQAMHREAVLFFVLNVVGLLIAEAVIGLVSYALGLHGALAYNAASFIGTGLGTIFRFYAYRKWVFLDPAAPTETPATLAGAPAVPDYPPWELDPAFLAPAKPARPAASNPAPAYVSPWGAAPAPAGPLTVPFAGARTEPFTGARTESFTGARTESFAGARTEPFAGSRTAAPVLDAQPAFPGPQPAAPPWNAALAAPVLPDFGSAPQESRPAPPAAAAPVTPPAPQPGPRPAGRHRKS
jgi:putative flippase GtrA